MKIELTWNAGKTATGRRRFNNVLVGASWSHHPSWPTRTTHLYLGLWVISVRTNVRGH